MISVVITEPSQVAEARRRAAVVAQSLGFDETATGRVSLVTTELATNIVKYGVQGEVLIASYEDETGVGVSLLAVDKGPGIADLGEALRDGHSTGGSPGTGLGAIRRQASAFDIASWPGRGTVVMARVGSRPGLSAGPPFHASLEVPLRGEEVSGDACCVRRRDGGWAVMLVDGLGHGTQAAEAAQEAVKLFLRHEGDPPGEILAAVHAGMRHTRGGAVLICSLDAGTRTLCYAGLGNVAGVVLAGDGVARMVSLPGTAGHVARRVKQFEQPFPPDAVLVMHSDGIATSWSLDRYPGLRAAHPSLIAATLYRDFARGRDDAAVLAVRGPDA